MVKELQALGVWTNDSINATAKQKANVDDVLHKYGISGSNCIDKFGMITSCAVVVIAANDIDPESAALLKAFGMDPLADLKKNCNSKDYAVVEANSKAVVNAYNNLDTSSFDSGSADSSAAGDDYSDDVDDVVDFYTRLANSSNADIANLTSNLSMNEANEEGKYVPASQLLLKDLWLSKIVNGFQNLISTQRKSSFSERLPMLKISFEDVLEDISGDIAVTIEINGSNLFFLAGGSMNTKASVYNDFVKAIGVSSDPMNIPTNKNVVKDLIGSPENLLNNIPVNPGSYMPDDGNNVMFSENQVGISLPTKDLMRWNSDGERIRSELESDGYKVDLQYATNDINTQKVQIQSMIDSGCKEQESKTRCLGAISKTTE